MDSCDSCSEFQYDEMTGEAKENVFKHIDGKYMCRNIHCAEIKSQVTGEGYKYCDTTNTCVEECAHGCVNHTHTRGDNCIVPQIPCCYNRNATNYLHILPEYQEHTHPWDECNVVKNSICTYLPGPSEADEDFSWDASKCHANGTKFGKFNFNDGSDGTAEMGLPNRLGEGDEGDSLVSQFNRFMETIDDSAPLPETTFQVDLYFDANGNVPACTGPQNTVDTQNMGCSMAYDATQTYEPTDNIMMWQYDEMGMPDMTRIMAMGGCIGRQNVVNPMLCSFMMCDVCYKMNMNTAWGQIDGYGGIGDSLIKGNMTGEYGSTWVGDKMEDLIKIYEEHEMSGLAYGKYIDICSAIKSYKRKHKYAYVSQMLQPPSFWQVGSTELKAQYLPGEAFCDFFREPRYPFESTDTKHTFNARKECCACGGGTCTNLDGADTADPATNVYGYGCKAYEAYPYLCATTALNFGNFNAQEMCCVCQNMVKATERGGKFVGAAIMGGGGQQRRRLLAEAGVSHHMQEHKQRQERIHAHMEKHQRKLNSFRQRRGQKTHSRRTRSVQPRASLHKP